MKTHRTKPWEAPGFKFYTDEFRAWLNGYEPVVARSFDRQIGKISSRDALRRRAEGTLVAPACRRYSIVQEG